MKEVPENQRADAANSLVYEANMRLRDPVYGCMGAISALQQQVQVLQAQLNAVRDEILKYKYKEANVANINSNINVNHATNYHLPTTFLSSGFVSIAVPLPTMPPSSPPPPPGPPGPTPSLGAVVASRLHSQPHHHPGKRQVVASSSGL